ncbi:MAG: hypothetical protein LBN97_03070 [Oscillospiraceae bacterium]|jgi:hypothetical protein|nr:hypothetical protein [Oscillospiraceae bacterium]
MTEQLAQRILSLTVEQGKYAEAGDSEGLNDSLDKRKQLLDELLEAGELNEAAKTLLRKAEALNVPLMSKTQNQLKSLRVEYAKAKRGLEKVGRYEATYSAVETEFSRNLDIEG